MTSKRTTKSDAVASGSAPAGIRKPRRSTAMHSAAVASTGAVTATNTEPAPIDTDAIARLAYSFYAERGYSGGSPEEDWLRAERQLKS